MVIGPNFDLKEHYYLKGGGVGIQTSSDPYANRNLFM